MEGVVYADWQPGDSANGLVINLSNWQEKKWFDDVTIDFDVAKMVENAGENARLPKLSQSQLPQHLEYLWQPGDADIPLPYGGLSICNAGWENGVLQMVMKGPVNQTYRTLRIGILSTHERIPSSIRSRGPCSILQARLIQA